MTRDRTPSSLRQMIEDRDHGRSDTRDAFDQARRDDPSVVHENAHLRQEADIDRREPARQPANDRSEFNPELGKQGQLTERFDRAREDDPSMSHEIPLDRGDRDDGSEMVRDAGPRLEPRPPEELEKPVTRESFARRWAAEMDRAGVDLDRLPERDQKNGLDREQDTERTLDRDR